MNSVFTRRSIITICGAMVSGCSALNPYDSEVREFPDNTEISFVINNTRDEDLRGDIVVLNPIGQEIFGQDNEYWESSETARYHIDLSGEESGKYQFRLYIVMKERTKRIQNSVDIPEDFDGMRVNLEMANDGRFVWSIHQN